MRLIAWRFLFQICHTKLEISYKYLKVISIKCFQHSIKRFILLPHESAIDIYAHQIVLVSLFVIDLCFVSNSVLSFTA